MKYITIHDGFDVSYAHMVQGKSVKQWGLESWGELVLKIRSELPGYDVIQLGNSKTARVIEGVTSMLDKTTLIEAFDILRGSGLHIDGDSGLAHAAAFLGVPSIVLWGATPAYFYGYAQNINITNSPCADACFWLRDDWMGVCEAGLNVQCMRNITAEMVFKEVKSALT